MIWRYPAPNASMRNPRAETLTASTPCSSGRGNHTAADDLCGWHRFLQLRAGPQGCFTARPRNSAQYSPRARCRGAAHDRRAPGRGAYQCAAQRRLRKFSSHRFGLSRPIWQGWRGAGGRPRRSPVVLLGHDGHRKAPAAQQSRDRGEGLRDQESALLKSVRRRGEEATDRDRRGAGASRRRSPLRHFLQPPIEIFQALIEKQRPSEDWTISIFDGDGINLARVPNPQETMGKRASPSLYAEMFRNPEATLQTVSLEGVPLITTFARSSLTGWTVAAGIAEGSLVGPLWRNLAITSVIGGVLLLTGIAFAVRMATAIARGEMLHDLLIEELNHRVKNTLAILQSIAVQTFRSASKAEREKFEGRLGALAEAHNLLSQEKWQGSELQDVVDRVLQPYLLNNPERVRMFGPHVPLSPRLAVVLSMILHEAATNAAKYGALSNDTGTVALDWKVITEDAKARLRLIWTEAGGPHVVAPVQRGFGSRLIERSARDQLGGEATVDFLPRGVVYTVICSLEDEG